MEYKDVVEKRRAINFFDSERNVSEALLREIVEMGAKAPSGFNLQPWNLIILRDMEEKKRLREKAWDQSKITEAPVVFIVLADRDGWREGHPTMEKNWQEMINTGQVTPDRRDWFLTAAKSLYGNSADALQAFANKNAGFFAMGLMYAATSLGLHTHTMDGFDHESVRKIFSIPDNYWVPLLMAVGYPRPGIEIQPPKWRKTYDEIVISFKSV
ncbi:nitroreductase [Desulfosarcina ovata subsp. sediminis]|uniref:Nitroreductase n=1 Tax=Desulfosarcina ovata subsp. sediminis TaxID=885957 RepID=A0A5K7ZRB8_9BACT|nr:nitroreductase family protein [Desulfosarcina ovata]BBO81073.1 nitroreductase [Desulfosarcina ovata subsp. sediminis]